MKQTQHIMGMPITIEVLDNNNEDLLNKVFLYFISVDEKFSTYKDTSEISQINRGELSADQYSTEMKQVLHLSEQTKQETNGYFDIRTPQGTLDPSGLVKGWAIYQASQILTTAGPQNYSIDAGGDIQVSQPNNLSNNSQEDFTAPWRIGIQNPFNNQEIIKVLGLHNEGMATSGIYNKGAHIYNPKQSGEISEIVSLTVVGQNVYEADRFATAAFAMGKQGIYFIEQLHGFEAYQINKDGIGTETTGFNKYVIT